MAKTDDEDGEEQPASIMAAKAGRSGQLEFSNRQTASSNLPCTPLVTHKDTRPRFYNPSYLSSHSLICSHTYTHYSIRKPAAEQICTPTHTSAKMIILLCCHRQVGATLSVSSPPPPSKTSPFLCICSSVLLNTIPISLTPPSWPHATIPLLTSHWPLFLCSVEPLA